MTLLIIYTLFEKITKKSYQTTIKIRGNERNHNDLEANKKNGKVQSNKKQHSDIHRCYKSKFMYTKDL